METGIHLRGLARATATAFRLRSTGYSSDTMWGLTSGPTAIPRWDTCTVGTTSAGACKSSCCCCARLYCSSQQGRGGGPASAPASFSMYMQGPGSNRAPRSASAITDTAPLRPCAA